MFSALKKSKRLEQNMKEGAATMQTRNKRQTLNMESVINLQRNTI